MKSVTIYTKPMCPYCERAKSLFTQLEVPYEEVNVLEHPKKRQELSEKHNWMTVPMIFVGEEFIGGFDDMVALHKSGDLLPKIQA